MSFEQLKKLYKKQLAVQRGIYPTASELNELVAERLLLGFSEFEEALEHAKQRLPLYTPEGWEVSPSAILRAVKELS